VRSRPGFRGAIHTYVPRTKSVGVLRTRQSLDTRERL
jgi:hypothetical protein